MRQETVNIYTVRELKEAHPAGFKRAHEAYVHGVNNHGTGNEDKVFDSLKATIAAFGATLRDWSIGVYSESRVKLGDGPDSLQCSGPRAFAVLERALEKHRVPWSGPKRRELAKYGPYYRPGMLQPCPFTGVCFDEDMLDSIRRDLRDGLTVREALLGLAKTAEGILERCYEDATSEEYFLDHADANEYEFYEDGERV